MIIRNTILLFSLTLLLLGCQKDDNTFEKQGPEIQPLVPVESFRQDRGREVNLSFELRAISGLGTLQVLKDGEPYDNINFPADDLIFQYDFNYLVEDLPDGTALNFTLEVTDQLGNEAAPFTFEVVVGPPFDITDETIAGTEVKVITGRINRDILLEAQHTYLINGLVSVEDNSTLTIEPGTTILMRTFNGPEDSRLAITKGCRIIAEGTKDSPIVFTSQGILDGTAAWGDWGGIFVYGNAPTNQAAVVFEDGFTYGGNNLGESSGSLRYVRIEYAGKSDADGIQLYGVGSGTQIRYLQVWNCFDNGIRFKGGAADIKYAVVTDHGAYGLWAEHGWRGRGQFLVFQTSIAATIIPVNFNNIARSLELRNDASNFELEPRTYTYISNVTMIGNGSTDADGTRRGFRVRRGAMGLFHNMIATNYPDDAVRVEDVAPERLDDGTMEIGNIHSWGNKTNYDELAEDYFLPNPDFNLSEEPVPGITPGNFVGSVPSPFNPAADARFGNWFTPAPYVGAVENEANDWTADGSWCKNQDGTIR